MRELEQQMQEREARRAAQRAQDDAFDRRFEKEANCRHAFTALATALNTARRCYHPFCRTRRRRRPFHCPRQPPHPYHRRRRLNSTASGRGESETWPPSRPAAVAEG